MTNSFRIFPSASSWPASLAGLFAALVGIFVLVGWAFDIAVLESILPGWVAVKPNTALAFVLTGHKNGARS